MAKKYEIVTVPKNEIVVYQPNETMRLEVAIQNETVWLTQSQLCELFGRERSVITKHINNAIAEGEISETNNVQILHKNQRGRPLALYDLDVIISVGYRVKSLMGTQFRRWAMKILKDYTVHGLAVNRSRDALAAEMDRRLANHEQRLAAVEQKVDFVVESALPAPEMVFMEGEFLTAHDALRKIVKAAKKRLIVIDNYIDERVLTLLAERREGVSCHVYGKNAAKRDVQLAFSRYQQQYPNGGLTLTQWSNAHDRFIVCDNTVWICGSSIKDAGRRMFALVKTGLRPDVVLSALQR